MEVFICKIIGWILAILAVICTFKFIIVMIKAMYVLSLSDDDLERLGKSKRVSDKALNNWVEQDRERFHQNTQGSKKSPCDVTRIVFNHGRDH